MFAFPLTAETNFVSHYVPSGGQSVNSSMVVE